MPTEFSTDERIAKHRAQLTGAMLAVSLIGDHALMPLEYRPLLIDAIEILRTICREVDQTEE